MDHPLQQRRVHEIPVRRLRELFRKNYSAVKGTGILIRLDEALQYRTVVEPAGRQSRVQAIETQDSYTFRRPNQQPLSALEGRIVERARRMERKIFRFFAAVACRTVNR